MDYALRHGTPIHYFEWLLDHGADPLLPDKNGTVPVAEAARLGRADVLELFEKRGVVVALEGDDAFLAACARANEAEARKLARANPSLVGRMQAENPGMLAAFAGAGNTAAVRLMLDLGFDAAMARITPNWVAGETALHVAAAHGRQPVAELLIERGARSRPSATAAGPAAGRIRLPGAAIGMDAERVHAADRRSADQGRRQRGSGRTDSDRGSVPRP